MMDNISLYCRRQADIPRHKMNASHIPTQNRCWYQKVFQNSIKSFGYIETAPPWAHQSRAPNHRDKIYYLQKALHWYCHEYQQACVQNRLGSQEFDFCITENKTWTRVHSTIYTFACSWFIEDNNSTYKTYVNCFMLKFSNEDFDLVEG